MLIQALQFMLLRFESLNKWKKQKSLRTSTITQSIAWLIKQHWSYRSVPSGSRRKYSKYVKKESLNSERRQLASIKRLPRDAPSLIHYVCKRKYYVHTKYALSKTRTKPVLYYNYKVDKTVGVRRTLFSFEYGASVF